MSRFTKSFPALLCAVAFYAAPAHAQATRTWVSGVGDDVNPCSRTAPCKTFAGAISKTANGGEINCLDPAGYGAVTINKSLTINCVYTEGGVLAAGNGIVVNATATDTIYLRGLDFFGVSPPTNGLRILVAAAVHLEDSTIRRFNAANSFGISFQPSGATQLFVSNTTIAENGSGSTGGGILIQPTGTGSARVVLSNVRVQNNANNGISVDITGNTGPGVTVVLDGVEISGSGAVGLLLNGPPGTTQLAAMVNNSMIVNNATGVSAVGPGATGRFANTTITGNATGIAPGGNVLSDQNNRLDGNPTVGAANNGSFTGTVAPH